MRLNLPDLKRNAPQTLTIMPSDIAERTDEAFFRYIRRDHPGLAERRIVRINEIRDYGTEVHKLIVRVGLFRLGNEPKELNELSAYAGKEGYLVLLFATVAENESAGQVIYRTFDRYVLNRYGAALVSEGVKEIESSLREILSGNGFLMSDPLAPGMDGFPFEVQRYIFYILDADELGAMIMDNGMIAPMNSLTRLYTVS